MEDVGHLLMRCTDVEEEREKFKELMCERVEGWQDMHDNDRVVVVIEHVEMKQLEGQWRDCGRVDLQHAGTIPQPRPQ